MFNKIKKVQKAFETIEKYIEECELDDVEVIKLKGLLANIKKRAEAA